MDTNTTEATETSDSTQSQTSIPTLTAEQEISALKAVHQFLSAFDRVPGALANQWAQALDTVAVVANSLISKTKVPENETSETSQTN